MLENVGHFLSSLPSNLDGETNLKVRQSLNLTSKNFGYENSKILDKLSKLDGSMVCEAPNKKLYDFSGSITINDEKITKKEDRQQPLSTGQLLLRGSKDSFKFS